MRYEDADAEYEYDDSDEYDDEYNDSVDPAVYSDPAVYYTPAVRKRGEVVPQGGVAARRAIDWGTTGSIVAVILLTLLYVLSPIDAIPDLIPVAGQADDVAAVTAGTATAGILAFVRIVLRAMLASRIGRKGCVILAAVLGIVGVLAFVGLLSLVNAIF